MAHSISQDFLERLKWPHYPLMHIRIFLFPLIRRVRKVLCKVIKPQKRTQNISAAIISNQFEVTQNHYQTNRWSWIPDVFPSNFYSDFVSHWPNRRYLNPPWNLLKSYDVGFRWLQGDTHAPQYIEYYPELHSLLKYLRSEEWLKRLEQYIKTDTKLICKSFRVNMTRAGSCVIPHKDDPLPQSALPFVNMVFFINGSTGGNSGELMLSNDSNQEDIFFVPPTLQNACIMYDAMGDFYHGFPPIAKGKFRWAITSSFGPAANTIIPD